MDRVKKVLISPKINIRQALKHMDLAAEKILFVVNDKNVILGVVTDGNIRRWILRGKSLNQPISKAMYAKPVVLGEDYTIEQAKELMLEKSIECIPVVGKDRTVISAIWWHDLFEKKTKVEKKLNLPVVLMAGGAGTRLSPFTKVLPKPLMLIGEKPISELIMDKFVKYGCRNIFMSVNYKSNIIKAYFDDFEHPYKLQYVRESRPLGTAGSLALLKSKLKSTFFVSNCDILIDADFSDILAFHRHNRNLITIVGSMKHYTIPYGVCRTGKSGKLIGISEKPEYDFLVNTGMYVLEPEVLKLIPRDTACHMTDVIKSCMASGGKVGVYPISEKSWVDIGQLEELKEMLDKYEV
jgi:dTDP-glucose pyrophosphorylase/predicted transcriptional regulator